MRTTVAPTLLLAAVLASAPLPAQEPEAAAAAPGETLVVGTKVAPPFAIQEADGSWRGIAIDLWARVAGELGYAYELEETDLAGLFEGLEDGSLDASVAALTVTAEREEAIDFSHPFYTTGLSIAVAPGQERGWLAALGALLSLDFLKAVGALALVLFVVGLAVWLFERRRNPEQFGGGVASGLGSAFWWSAVTMTTVGYGDKAPLSVGGRLVGLLWMFASIIMISGFTAAIASGLTVARLGSPVQGPDDLPDVRVGAPAGSTGEVYLRQRRIPVRVFPSPGEALAALTAGQVDAVVYDEPILRYLAGDLEQPVRLLAQTVERQDYAVALPSGSPLREPLNRALLRHTTGPTWDELLATYLGERP